jgi:polysaccharide export outer membrane protein
VDTRQIEGIKLVDVDDALAKKLAKAKQLGRFSDIFPSHSSNNYLIGPGDIIEVSIWEAQPPMLFSGVSLDGKAASTSSPAVTLPKPDSFTRRDDQHPFAGKCSKGSQYGSNRR